MEDQSIPVALRLFEESPIQTWGCLQRFTIGFYEFLNGYM